MFETLDIEVIAVEEVHEIMDIVFEVGNERHTTKIIQPETATVLTASSI